MRKRLVLLWILFWCLGSGEVFGKTVTLKEKIGQMIIIGFEGLSIKPNDPIVKAILSQQIGGVILFDYDFNTQTFNRNIQTPEQLRRLTCDLQTYAKKAAKRKGNALYPLFISVDYEGGVRGTRLQKRHGFARTLSAAELGKLSKASVRRYANQMADTLSKSGINLNFAPVLDVNVNPSSPAIGKVKRSFSADPEVVVQYAEIFSKAYQDRGIICAYKHFPGHGSAAGDTHEGFVDVTKTWKSLELKPYEMLLKQPFACPMVMVAHVVHSKLDKQGLPASLSSSVIQGLLRKTLNFNGVVVTDDLQMKAIINHYGLVEALRLTVNAGADILVFGNQLTSTPQDPKKIVDLLYAEVKAGEIPESRIQEAYDRIIKLKKRVRVNR